MRSPDGAGTYTFVKNRANIKGMPVTLYWDGVRHGTTVHHDYPEHPADPVYGGEVAFSLVAPPLVWGSVPRPSQREIVATVLQFIQSGRKVYMNECGGVLAVTI